MTAALLVAAGASVGAPARYLTDRYVQRRVGAGLPWGTFTVNVVGSFILGMLVAAAGQGLDPRWVQLAGTGFCGALTTYSTFGYETLRLAQAGPAWRPVANVVGSVALGLAAATAGWALGLALR